MEGRKEPEDYSRGDHSSKRMRNKRKQSNSNNAQRSFGDLPPEVAQHYLSQMTGAAAAAWDSQMLGGGSSGNGNGGQSSKSDSNSGGVAFGPSRPPNAGGEGGNSSSGASLSFGSLDLAALAQSGSLEFSSAVAAAAATRDSSSSNAGGAGSQCSEAEMKALCAMFVEIMGMNMDNNNTTSTSSSSSTSAKSASKQSMAQAARNFLQANSSAAAAAAAAATSTNTSPSSSSNNPFPVFMFGNSGNGQGGGTSNTNAANSIPTPPGGWPSTSAAAAAAAAFARINGFTDSHYYDHDTEDDDDDDDDDDDSLPELHGPSLSSKTKSTGLDHHHSSKGNSGSQQGGNNNDDMNNGFSPAALAALEQEEIDDALHEEEQQRKAAKKREKKQRKKERAKKEAAAKAAQAAQKKREKLILSWRSRVVSACQANEVPKLESLLGESPFLKHANNSKNTASSTEESQDDKEQQIQTQNKCLEFLLPNCIAKSRTQVDKGFEGRQKLTDFILTTNTSLVFTNGRNGRTAIHTACFSGDVHFIKLVLDRANAAVASSNSNELPESYLNIHCEDSGWTPLHYAVVSGSLSVFETMLASGCDIQKQTNEKTCRVRGNGVTARELAEIIRSGKPETMLETQGDALQEVIDGYLNNSSERSRFLRILEKINDRLIDVEHHGYSPPTDPSISGSLKENTSTDEINKDATLRRATSSISDNDATKKKKQKKKKKKAQQQQQVETAPAPKPAAAPESAQAKEEDPMISALLGMGFNMDQISAAAKACGGYHRATADDLVMWIFSQQDGGTPADDPPSPLSQTDTASNTKAVPEQEGFVDPNSQKPETKQQQQPDPRAVAAAQAQKAAAKREEEARLAAQKLAAKKEEQRRRNREWNNREQARQKEEADAKLAQEVERRARVETQRVMMERMAAQQQQQQQMHGAAPPGMVGVPQQISYSANAPPMGANAAGMNRGPPMGGPTHILQSSGEMRSLSGYGSGSHPHNKPQIPVHGHPPTAYGMPPHQSDFSQMPPMTGPGMGMEGAPMMNAAGYNDAYDQSPMNMPGMHGEMQPPATVEVNSFEYPGLAKDDGTVSSMGSGRQRDSRGGPKMYQSRSGPSTPKGMRGVNASSSTPPPGFVPTPSTSSSSTVPVPVQPTEEEQGTPNPLGEIRATAKAFVPTNFKPSPAPAAPVPIPVPVPAPTTSEILSESAPSDPPSWMGGLTHMEQPGIEDAASSILDAPTSLLPGTDPFVSSSSMGLTEETAVSGDVPPLTDAPEATSSILDQLGVGGVSAAASGVGIWGESETNSSVPAFTGVPSLSFGEGTLSLGSQQASRTFGTVGGLFDGEENKDSSNNINTWGSGGGVDANNGGLGSIW